MRLRQIILVIGGTLVVAQEAPGQNPLRLALRPVQASVGTADPVIIEVRVENSGSMPVRAIVPLEWPNAQFFIEVRGPNDTAVAPVNVAATHETPMELRDRSETVIPAGGFVGGRVTLSADRSAGARGFDFSRPGVYRVVAFMHVLDPASGRGWALAADTTEVRVRP
jgi:hypothetical protein